MEEEGKKFDDHRAFAQSDLARDFMTRTIPEYQQLSDEIFEHGLAKADVLAPKFIGLLTECRSFVRNNLTGDEYTIDQCAKAILIGMMRIVDDKYDQPHNQYRFERHFGEFIDYVVQHSHLAPHADEKVSDMLDALGFDTSKGGRGAA